MIHSPHTMRGWEARCGCGRWTRTKMGQIGSLARWIPDRPGLCTTNSRKKGGGWWNDESGEVAGDQGGTRIEPVESLSRMDARRQFFQPSKFQQLPAQPVGCSRERKDEGNRLGASLVERWITGYDGKWIIKVEAGWAVELACSCLMMTLRVCSGYCHSRQKKTGGDQADQLDQLGPRPSLAHSVLADRYVRLLPPPRTCQSPPAGGGALAASW